MQAASLYTESGSRATLDNIVSLILSTWDVLGTIERARAQGARRRSKDGSDMAAWRNVEGSTKKSLVVKFARGALT